MNFNNILFRCSSLGHLLTEPKLKADKEAGNLSEGAKTHLIDVYVANKYGRQDDISSKYITKGLMVEEDGITLYSRVKKEYFLKNEGHLSNLFIKGTPDLYMGKSIHQADTIIDIKCSWDIYTFFRVLTKDVNSLYYWQLQGYMALTGAKSANLAYCLVNTPEILINDEKRKLMYKMGAATDENKEFQEACIELEKAMLFDDIPMTERVIEFNIERCDEDIEKLYSKVRKARVWLNEFEAGRFGDPVSVLLAHQESGAVLVEGEPNLSKLQKIK